MNVVNNQIFPISKYNVLEILIGYKKEYSAKTIKSYVGHLNRYLDFSNNKVDIMSVNRYLLNLLEKKHLSHSFATIYQNQAWI